MLCYGSKLSAISFIHKLCNLPDPCECFLIKHMLTEAKLEKGFQRKKHSCGFVFQN